MRPHRDHMLDREAADGFSLVELLVAITICAIVSAGFAALVPTARAAFEVTPAELELQQRARLAVDLIVQSIRGAGGDAVVSDALGPVSGVVPPIVPSAESGGRFTQLKVIAPRPHAAQGVLQDHQVGSTGALVLATGRCPDAAVLCGFSHDTEAILFDGSGRFDVFTVAAVDAAAGMLWADRALNPPYSAGSVVLEADVHTLQLQPQADGSQTLVRVTGGGAVQPLVDRVSALEFELYALDESGAVIAIPASQLADGPWLSGAPDGLFDEDVFRIMRAEVRLALQAAPPASMVRTFRFGTFLRNVP